MSQNIFPIDFEEKNTICNNDFILFSDSQDCNKLKKAQYSNLKGEKWDTGNAATVCVGSTTTGTPWSSASVTNSWDCHSAVLNFVIPAWIQGCKWDTWDPGTAATVTIGTTTTWDAWTCACVTNSGTCLDAVLNFTIPKGAKWDTGCPWAAATICVGTTTTLDAWCSATVSNSGSTSAAVFNFGIPKWETGCTGATWNGIACVTSSKAGKVTTVTICETNGCSSSFCVCDWADGQWAGDVSWPASSCNWHLAVFDGTSWKCIKDGGAIPTPTTVVDSLDSTSTTSALSANQGKVLDGKISNLFGLGKFLSLWDATTWLPDSFPLETPYTYTTWDYFLVETVSTATPPVNYKPNGSSYNGTASSTTESDELEVGDVYIYDGSVRLLQSNHGKTVSFTNIAWDALDNTNLSGYLNTKAFTLASTSDTTTAQAALDRYLDGRNPIVMYNGMAYQLYSYSSTLMYLYGNTKYSDGVSNTSLVNAVLLFNISSNTVTSISYTHSNIIDVLRTGKDYGTPYTPQYNGSPATKKYVDDKISDTAFSASRDGDTTHAPSKNAVYDVLGDVETLLAAL